VRKRYLLGKLRSGKLLSRAASRVSGQLYMDRGAGPADSILLAGSARTGTTWISDIINRRNEYRYIFEPFHPNRLDMTRNFKPRQYLRPDDRDPAFLRPAEAILSGRVRSVWTDKYNRKRLADKRLIKEVRGNLLLGWIHCNFPQTRIVLLLRHPCAVANSQLDLDWNWHLDLAGFLAQQELVEDFLGRFQGELSRPRPKFEQHLLLWCVENYVPLQQFERGEIHVAFYENFCVDPETEIRRMFAFLGKDFDQSVLDDLRRPSAVTRKKSAIVSGGSLVDSWRAGITEDQVRSAVQIVSLFGLDRIYSEDPMPRLADPADALLGRTRQ